MVILRIFGINNLDYFMYSLYTIIGILVIFLVYRKLLAKIKAWEKEMDRLYRELWTKIKSEGADKSISIIVVNSRINHLKEEYAGKIDHIETKRDLLLKKAPLVALLYKRRRQKEKQKRSVE